MQSMQARVDEAKQGSELATEKMEHMTKEVAKELNKVRGHEEIS